MLKIIDSFFLIYLKYIPIINQLLHAVHECMLSRFSHVQFFVTLWIVAHQAPLSMEILQARILGCIAISYSRESCRPRN